MDDYPEILTRIGGILAGLNPFELKFSGFAFFPPRPDRTFYIKPDECSGKQIIKYCKTIQDHCDTRFRKKYSWTNEAKKDPHMSVGHDILESEVLACNTLANEGFEKSFSCDSFVIRRFNESKRQYDIIDTIPLLGQEYIAGEQLSLF
jgi:2'-5' RNA ligase